MGENEEGTGAGRAVRPRQSGGAAEGLGGVRASRFPCSPREERHGRREGLGVSPGCARLGSRAAPRHPGTGNGPGAVASAQTQRRVSDRGADIVVSYGYQFRGAARPWRPVGIWNHKISVSRIRRPGFEFLAVKHWANHVISLKSVHWRPGPGSALTHSLSPLPSTPPPASARLQFPPKETSCSVPPQACSPVNFPEYTSGPVVLSNPPVPIAHRSN